jgi:hypothetical protein
MQHSVGFMRPQRRTARVSYLQVNLHLAQSAATQIQFCVMGQFCLHFSKDKYIHERFDVNIYLLIPNESRTGRQDFEHINTEGAMVSSVGTRYFALLYTYRIYIYYLCINL